MNLPFNPKPAYRRRRGARRTEEHSQGWQHPPCGVRTARPRRQAGGMQNKYTTIGNAAFFMGIKGYN